MDLKHVEDRRLDAHHSPIRQTWRDGATLERRTGRGDTLITTEACLRELQQFRATVNRTPPMSAREAGRLHAAGRIDKDQHAACR